MEYRPEFDSARERPDDQGSSNLEEQLESAERRFALACARARRARDECHALEAELAVRAELARNSRERFEAAEQKCARLRQLIEELEERLG